MGQDVRYKMKAEYSQEQDSTKPVGKNSEDNQWNFLDIKTCNGGGGTYYVLKTKRWAFDDAQELFDIINDFIDKSKLIKDGDNN